MADFAEKAVKIVADFENDSGILPYTALKNAIESALREMYEAGAEHAGDGIGGLLAIIHGDGGHYQQQHGTEKAITDAAARWYTKPDQPPPGHVLTDDDTVRKVLARRWAAVHEDDLAVPGAEWDYLFDNEARARGMLGSNPGRVVPVLIVEAEAAKPTGGAG